MIAEQAEKAGLEQSDGMIDVTVEAIFKRPKSHMTKAGVKATAPRLPRPDVDNIAKAILDSLQDVMGDDTNVRRLTIEKRYGQEAMTTVTIEEASQ